MQASRRAAVGGARDRRLTGGVAARTVTSRSSEPPARRIVATSVGRSSEGSWFSIRRSAPAVRVRGRARARRRARAGMPGRPRAPLPGGHSGRARASAAAASRSRVGWVADEGLQLPDERRVPPEPSSASIRSSCAATRSSSSRAASCRAKSSSPRSASAGPRQSPSASLSSSPRRRLRVPRLREQPLEAVASTLSRGTASR